ncbi:MAG: M48 family metalloprotease [Rhodospirillaceae bacterium]|jgi:predicted Zn-dependent protease|nr:M48 family metalloprotease [Rhodospirillaceae bacterium]MBT3491306.1 M48 family metalloprotease [Rhodospirillaceae bacterium]MBT3978566.1 M48 family metalloprotease [Rhodospirillaceae bacterium]MBT4169260.1 M48 family metalloprotease [Rhodospirillaceae bacterium]MBT4561859.1 M48 family metalloprotease [Rhodospirillaceae bacterium]
MCFDHPCGQPSRNLLDRRQLLAGLASAGALAGTAGCVATNAASGRDSFTGFQSIKDDIAEGRANHPKILKSFGGAYEDRRLAGYVQNIGLNLAKGTEYQQYPYRFTILNTQIVNAFALPGGFVYITRGLLALASSEAELAGVLSHELAHVTARHGAERRGAQQIAQLGLLLGAVGLRAAGLPSDLMQIGQTVAMAAIKGYSREHEFEADTLGVRYMSRAGYNADAMASFLGSLREHSMVEARVLGLPPGKVDEFNIMSTHPRTMERVKQAQAAAASGSGGGRWRRDEYLNHLDGMMFGDDPKQGVIRGRKFIHPELRFEFQAPEGFRLRNSPARVEARHPSAAAMIFDMAPAKGASTAANYLRHVWAAKTRLRDLESVVIDGHRAATAWAEGRGQNGPVQIRALAIRRDRDRFYRFMYISPLDQARRWARPFRQSGLSFRRIGQTAAAKVRAHRLLVVPARPDDNIAGLARTLPYGQYNESWFRVLNDLAPNQPIRKDQRLKIVAG